MFNTIAISGSGINLIPPIITSGDVNASSPWYTIHWTNINPNWEVKIYRSTNGGAFSLIHTTSPGETSYSDPTANTYEDNIYHLTHHVGARESVNFSTIAFNATTIRLTSATATNTQPGSCPGTGAENSISWNYEGNSAGYSIKIEVSVDGGAYSTLASGLSISSSPQTHGLDPLYVNVSGSAKTYTYRISATKVGIHASDSPKLTNTLNLTLATCGV